METLIKKWIWKLCMALFICFFSIDKAHAQAKLVVDTIIDFNSSVVAPTIDSFRVVVKNVGNQPFNNFVNIHYWATDAMDTSIIWSSHTVSGDSLYLMPGDTMSVNILDTINGSTYKGGSSVVVIWPVDFPAGAHRAIRHIDNLQTSTIKLFSTITNMLFYPNPFTQEIFFKKQEVKSICLKSANGVVIPTVLYETSLLPKEELCKGLYVLEWIDFENKNYSFKMIKE